MKIDKLGGTEKRADQITQVSSGWAVSVMMKQQMLAKAKCDQRTDFNKRVSVSVVRSRKKSSRHEKNGFNGYILTFDTQE